MRQSVRDSFRPFTTSFEGEVPEMYTDVLGLVTCGIGNLIDPLPAALSLPWIHRASGTPATMAEVSEEWRAVKFGKLHWYKGRPPRAIVLSPEGLSEVFMRRFEANEQYLARRWALWNLWPADAQMGAHSNAWAAGSGWQAPAFDMFVRNASGDGFRSCAGKAGYDPNDPSNRGAAWLRDTRPEDDARGVHGPTLNPGLRPRNMANQTLFQNAAVVLASGFDPERLYWPMQLDG